MSYQDTIPFMQNSSKFPSIHTGGLVTTANFFHPARSFAENWATNIRRQIDYAINKNGRPHQEDVSQLHQEIIKLMINILQTSSTKESWLDLCSALSLVKPYTSYLSSGHGRIALSYQMQHYVERLFLCHQKDMEKLFDVPIIDKLKEVYPNEVIAAQEKFGKLVITQNKIKNEDNDSSKILDAIQPSIQREVTFSLPNGKNPYALLRKGEKPESMYKPKPLTLEEFSDTIGLVAIETVNKESTWKSAPSLTVAALGVNFPSNKMEEDYERFSSYSMEDSVSTSSTEVLDTKVKKEAPFHPMSGSEAVKYFLAGRHLNKVKFLYLNIVESNYFRPYELISVPQIEVNPEHYVFSSFGVLHVYPDGTRSETITLAEWNRQAILWSIISKIPFFHNFLQAKTFLKWKNNVRRIRLARMRQLLRTNMLQLVPEFGLALLHIFRLIQELSQVSLLPEKQEHTQFTLLHFQMEFQKRRDDAENKLELFFRYCKKVINVTRQQCFDQLKFFEYQARHTHNVFTKESLYLQRQKREVRAKNLVHARHVTQQLSRFISLIDQVLSVHIIAIVRESVKLYVYGLLCMKNDDSSSIEGSGTNDDSHSVTSSPSKTQTSTLSTKGGSTTKTDIKIDVGGSVFVTKLVFNKKTHGLEMSPSPEELKEAMFLSIHGIIKTVCKKAYSMSTSEVPPSSSDESFDNKAQEIGSSIPSERSSVTSLTSEEDAEYPPVNHDSPVAVYPEEMPTEVEGLKEPVMKERQMPTKEEDNLGVATPNFVPSPDLDDRLGLSIGGHGIMGQYNPLDQSKLKNKFYQDAEISSAIQTQSDVINSALGEVEMFCLEQNMWLCPIRAFCAEWNEIKLNILRGKPAREIEDMLNQIKSWTEMVKSMERTLLSQNRLLFVDCRVPQTEVVPSLSHIFKQIINMIVSEAKLHSQNVTSETRDALKILKNKELNMKSFAAYARKVTESQKKQTVLADKVQYIKSLHEVIRMTYRQLTHDEDKQDEKVKSSWEAFVFQLKDATNFVTNQRPVILKQLNNLYKEQCGIASKLLEEASSGIVLNPEEDPVEVIQALKSIREQFTKCKSQLENLSHCRQSVAEDHGFDITWLQSIDIIIEKRTELWNSMYASEQTIKGWKNTLFRRFNAQAAMTKINDWIITCENFRHYLPPDDPVIQCWMQKMNDFKVELPYLHMMANEAVKSRHWKQIFTGMGESFEPGWTFTVDDLFEYQMSHHDTLLHQVFHRAVAEYNLDVTLRKVKNKWEIRQYNLAKHIHMVKKTKAEEKENLKQRSPQSKTPTGKEKSEAVYKQHDSDTYILVGASELLAELADSHVCLQSMLQSKHADEVRGEAEIWSDTLQQIGEIINLWTSCQDKWMYLTKVFAGDPLLLSRFPQEKFQFDAVDRKYREFIKTMTTDPAVLSVLSRRHGQKGWRELQGEQLRKHLLTCINLEEEILYNISQLLEEYRSEFPRMYFLCDEDCIRLLGISRQPKLLLPYAMKCFDGVKSLVYKLPEKYRSNAKTVSDGSGNSLNLELQSHKLQVTHMIGCHGEVVKFLKPLQAQTDTTIWLQKFEENMKEVLQHLFHSIIKTRFAHENDFLTDVLQEISQAQIKMLQNEEVDKDNVKFDHWLLKYPSQIVLLFESAKWTFLLKKALKNGGKRQEFNSLSKELLSTIKKYSEIIQSLAVGIDKFEIRKRIYFLVMALIEQSIYQRDTMKMLVDAEEKGIESYDWKRLIKHNLDINIYKGLRFPSHPEKDIEVQINSFTVDQFNGSNLYGFEYFGQTDLPIVVTPLTERCMLSLCTAIQIQSCGTLMGPEGTGKSTIVTKLAQVFGKPLINLGCSGELNIAILCRTISGAVESGAWLCFDQVHRLRKEVLSTLCQQIRHIQQAYSILLSSKKSEYSTRAKQIPEETYKRTRSNSVPSLHYDVDNSIWNPDTSSYHLMRMCQHKEFSDTHLYKLYQEQVKQPDNGSIGNIRFNGNLLKAQNSLALFMTLTSSDKRHALEIPYNMKLVYRPISVVTPDITKIIEVLLRCSGFSDAVNLSKKLFMAYQAVNGNSDNLNNIPSRPHGHEKIRPVITEAGKYKIADMHLKTLSAIIRVASLFSANSQSRQRSRAESEASGSSAASSINSRKSSSRHSDAMIQSHNDELSIANAMMVVLKPKINNASGLTCLRNLLRTVFPLVTRPMSSVSEDTKLQDAIHQQLLVDGFQSPKELIDKICQLNTTLKINKSVILVGPSGSGKTSLYRTLSKAVNTIVEENQNEQAATKHKDGMISRRSASQVMNIHAQRSRLSTGHMSSNDGLSGVEPINSPAPLGRLPEGFQTDLFQNQYSKVDVTVVFPNALNFVDLFGDLENENKSKKIGILSKIFKDSYATVDYSPMELQENKCQKWIVLDGEMQHTWAENLYCLTDSHNKSHLPNMDDLNLNQSTNIIYEVADFSLASPSMISRCGIVYCGSTDQWQHLITSWMSGAYGRYAVTLRTIKAWTDLMNKMIAPMLEFLLKHCTMIDRGNLSYSYNVKSTVCYGLQEVSAFLHIFEALLNVYMNREDFLHHEDESSDTRTDIFGQPRKRTTSFAQETEHSTVTYASSVRSKLDNSVPSSHHQIALNLYATAFVWGFGGKLIQQDVDKFDDFVRDLLSKSKHDLKFPSYETVFDYFVEEDTGKMTLWEDKIDLRPRHLPPGSTYTFVHQLERYAYFSSVLLKSHFPVMLIGDAGCGKTSLISNLLSPEMEMTIIPVSPGLTPAHLQKIIESRTSPFLKQHNLGLMAHPSAIIATRMEAKHKALFFLDDISCGPAYPNSQDSLISNVQPINELIRQILSVGGIYDRERLLFKTLEGDINFITTATSTGSMASGTGSFSHLISPRLARLFTTIYFASPSKEMILSIYHNSVQSWLEEFPAYSLNRHYDLSQAIIAGSFDLYMSVKTHLRPSPNKAHYIFNLHNIASIMQGLFLLSPRSRGKPRPMRIRQDREMGGPMKRPGGGRVGGRFRQTRGMGSNSLPPMTRTVIRVWLHECSRTFYDRLADDHDRHWFSRSLQDLFKKHFCTAKDERAVSPAVERVRIIKTPIPSSGTPLPYREEETPSSSNLTENMTTTGVSDSAFEPYQTSQSGTEIENQESSLILKQEFSETSVEEDVDAHSTSSAGVIRLTPSSLSQINRKYKSEYPSDEVVESYSSMETRSRIPLDVLSLQDDKEKDYSFTPVIEEDMSKTNVSESDGETAVLEKDISAESEILKSEVQESSVEILSEHSETTHDNYESEAASTVLDSRAETMDMTDDEEDTQTVVTDTLETETSGNKSSSASTSTDGSKSKTPSKSSKLDNEKLVSSEAPQPSGSVKEQGKVATGVRFARPGGAKLGVTFVPGLIDDPERAVNTVGPLVEFNQIIEQGEDPAEIIFSKNILPYIPGKSESYNEATYGQINHALIEAQQTHNLDNPDNKLDLVYFTEAMKHAARLSRIFAINKGHSILLSSSRYTGRRSLTRLVAYLFKAVLFETGKYMENSTESKQTQLRSVIKEASLKAGVNRTTTVLLVDESFATNYECVDDICTIIRDGQCSALYSHDELAVIGAECMPGSTVSIPVAAANRGSNTTLEKLDKYLNKYFIDVTENLHIVMLLPYKDSFDPHEANILQRTSKSAYFHHKVEYESFHKLMLRCPDLVKKFQSINLFERWNHLAWSKVAEKWLLEYTEINDSYADTPKFSLPWPMDISPILQIYNLSHLMAFMHLDSVKRTSAAFPRIAEELLTPTTFKMFSNLLINTARKIENEEKKKLKKYEQVLRKVQDADNTLERYLNEKANLLPRLDAAQDMERAWKRHVEQERREYVEAKQRCTIEEEVIENLEVELKQLQEESETAFGKVNPMYSAALQSIDALSDHCLYEMKLYKTPPKAAVKVMECLCKLFDVKPVSWETGKALIMQDNFFQELEFFNKDKIPEHIYINVGNYVKNPSFHPTIIAKGSRAAESLCSWIHAVYNYATVSRYLAPKIAKLKEREAKMVEAQATLGAKRVRCNQIKEELDSKIEQHKSSSRVVKQFERELKNLQAKIHKAETLHANLDEYVQSWRQKRDQTLSRFETAIGDSLLTAACVTYHSVLPLSQQKMSLNMWMKACSWGQFDTDTQTFEINEMENANKESSPPDISTPQQPHSAATSNYSKTSSDSLTLDDDGRTYATSSRGSRQFYRPLAFIRGNFDPLSIVMTDELKAEFHKGGYPKDKSAQTNILRLLHITVNQDIVWPLMFDPDDQLSTWIKFVFKNMSMFQVPEKTDDSPFPSAGNESRSSSIVESEQIYDDTETITTDQYTDYEDYESTTVISVTTTSQTIKSTTPSTKPRSDINSQRSKGVRFADSESEDILPVTPAKKVSIPTEPESVMAVESTPTRTTSTSEGLVKNFLICEADNPKMLDILAEAALNGSCILVTHVEKASTFLFNTLLLYHNIGKRISNIIPNSITISDSVNYFHPDFKLFLSTSVSLDFPLESCFTKPPMASSAVLNFGLTEEGLEEKLTQIVLAQELSEFEGQQKLMEADIFHLEQQYQQLHDNLLLKVSRIEGAILSDVNLVEAIQTCRREAKGTYSTLEETKMMEASLLQRKVHIIEVAKHGSMLYKNLKMCTVLNEDVAYWTASKFISLYKDTLKKHVRGKGSMNNGANAATSLMKSRIIELNRSLINAVVDQLQLSMQQTDVLVYVTLLSLELLKKINKLSDAENKLPSKSQTGLKPKWISNDAWQRLISLEQQHFQTFGNLTISISRKSAKWQEYFSSPPFLMAELPCATLKHLSIGQIALLWITAYPNMSRNISLDLANSILGSTALKLNMWSIKTLLDIVPNHEAVVFYAQSNSFTPFMPTYDIKNAGDRLGINVVERAAPYGDKISDIMEECITDGHWLILCNAELERNWSHKTIELLHSLSRQNQHGQDDLDASKDEEKNTTVNSDEEIIKTEPSSQLSDHESIQENVKVLASEEIFIKKPSVHPNFRLWIVTTLQNINNKTNLPGIILQHGHFVNLQLPNSHQKLLEKTFENVNHFSKNELNSDSRNILLLSTEHQRKLEEHKTKISLQLTLLYVLLQERNVYKPFEFVNNSVWSDSDLYILLEFIQKSIALEYNKEYSINQICEDILTTNLIRKSDFKVVNYFIQQTFYNFMRQSYLKQNPGILNDIKTLLFDIDNPGKYFYKLTENVDLNKLELTRNSDKKLCENISLNYQENLLSVTCFGETKLKYRPFTPTTNLPLSHVEIQLKRIIENLLMQISGVEVPKEVSTNSPLEQFYFSEVCKILTVLNLAKRDLDLSLSSLKGESEVNHSICDILESLYLQKIPDSWIELHKEIFLYCSFYKPGIFFDKLQICCNGIATFVESLVVKQPLTARDISSANSNSSSTQTTSAYNLNQFVRPDLFLQAFVAQVAKKNYQDPHKYEIKAEVLSPVLPVYYDSGSSIKAVDFIDIVGLTLHNSNYDSRNKVLVDTVLNKAVSLPTIRLSIHKVSRNIRPNNEQSQQLACPVFVSRRNQMKTQPLFFVHFNCEDNHTVISNPRNIFITTS